MKKALAVFSAVLLIFAFYSFSAGKNAGSKKPESGTEAEKGDDPGGKGQVQRNPPGGGGPKRWVEVRVQDGLIDLSVEGPGVTTTTDWALITIHSNTAYGLEIEPDSYLDTTDGLHLGRAVSATGDEIGYYLLVKEWPRGRCHQVRNKPFRLRAGGRTRTIALGASAGGTYTRDRTPARIGQYRGLVNVYAYVLH